MIIDCTLIVCLKVTVCLLSRSACTGGEGGVREIFEISRRGGVEECSGSRGMSIYGGLATFLDPGGMAYVGQ